MTQYDRRAIEMRTLIAAMLVLAVCVPTALARTWTDSTGKYTVEAEFVEFKDGKVRLKKENGHIINITLKKLSDADREFVMSQRQAEKTDVAEATARTRSPAKAAGGPPAKSDSGDSASAEPLYFDVRGNTDKYVGRTVAWVAHFATYSHSTSLKTGEETTTYVYLARDAKGNFFADYPFLFSHSGDDTRTKRTASAIKADKTPSDKGIRIIRGTVKGEAEFKDMKGNVSHVPELTGVTVDAP
jgi:hypothetical protein